MAALIVGGIVGFVAELADNDQSDSDNDVAALETALYAEQDRALEEIANEYAECSAEWVRASAANTVELVERVIRLSDREAHERDLIDALTQLCSDGELEGYCEGNADSLLRWSEGDIGSFEDIKRGCLNRAQ